MVYTYKMSRPKVTVDEFNEFIEKFNDFITFVNGIKNKLNEKLNKTNTELNTLSNRTEYIEKNGMSKKGAIKLLRENREAIKALQKENSFLRNFLYTKYPGLEDQYREFKRDYRGATSLVDLQYKEGGEINF